MKQITQLFLGGESPTLKNKLTSEIFNVKRSL